MRVIGNWNRESWNFSSSWSALLCSLCMALEAKIQLGLWKPLAILIFTSQKTLINQSRRQANSFYLSGILHRTYDALEGCTGIHPYSILSVHTTESLDQDRQQCRELNLNRQWLHCVVLYVEYIAWPLIFIRLDLVITKKKKMVILSTYLILAWISKVKIKEVDDKRSALGSSMSCYNIRNYSFQEIATLYCSPFLASDPNYLAWYIDLQGYSLNKPVLYPRVQNRWKFQSNDSCLFHYRS